MNSTGREVYDGGRSTVTSAELSARASGGPSGAKCWFTASATRAAVVKSACRNCSFSFCPGGCDGGGLLHDRAVRDPAHRRMIHRLRRAPTPRQEPACQHVSLRHGVGFPVGGFEWRQKEHAA